MSKNIKPLIFGISSTSLSPEEIELFSKNQVVGFILFSRNIESKEQLLNLTASLKNLYPERDVPIFIDQEGGRVARIKPPIAKQLYPAAEHFSSIYDIDKPQAKLELKSSYIDLMSELKSFGIDSPCAPVCDIRHPGADDIIGDRSFGDNADKVIDLCKSAIAGIEHSGGLPFIKHIPGHGRAMVDSHFDLPIVSASLQELEETDFKVFKALSEETLWAMTAHIIYEALDPNHCATISPTVINYIRTEIGFKGQLVTDDICMYALHGKIGQKNATLKRVITLAANNKNWKDNYSEPLNKLFDINTDQIGHSLIIEICEKKLLEIKGEFIDSLAKVTKMSLDAGCDIALHCSGDIEEMAAVCGVL